MQLPHFLPDSLQLLRLAKDEEELLALLRTRPSSHLFLFFMTMAQDEEWCEQHIASATYVIKHLTDAFLAHKLALEQAQQIAAQMREHPRVLLPLLACDLLCLVEGEICPISSLLLGVESKIIRTWLLNQSNNSSSVQKPFTFGEMSLSTYRCLEEYLTAGRNSGLLLSSLDALKRHLLDSVTWELENFRTACIEAIGRKLTMEELPIFLPLAMQLSLQDLKLLCCNVWNRFDSGIELHTDTQTPLGGIIHAFHLRQWPLFTQYSKWITKLKFCGNTASHPNTKELISLCKNVTCYDLERTESCDDALMPYFFTAQELRLANCLWLDNTHVEQLFSHITQLKRLDLSNNPQITKQAWNRLKYYDGIQTLQLTYYHIEQKNELILILLLLASKATEIDLSWSSGVQDEVLEIFTKQNSSILILRLSHCENITDATLHYCQQRLHTLHTLDLSGDVQLSEEAIETYALTAGSLQTLVLRRCEISPLTIAHIRKKRPDVNLILS